MREHSRASLIGLGRGDLRQWEVHGKAGLRKVLGVRKTEEEREEMERVLGKKPARVANGREEEHGTVEQETQMAIRV